MFKNYLIIAIFIATLAFCFGCNSPIYDIVEVEEPIEIKEEPKQETPPFSEIKSDITEKNEDVKPTENTFSEKLSVTKSFCVQLGAFNEERNASRYSDRVKRKFANMDISVKNIDGLYKIRMGNFSTKDEALAFLYKLWEMGYSDSFYLEQTMKSESK
ncbi:MAG: SPOR domain-containing protein [Ignavibacteria bacterium]|nr:SPOR domain-containing protein [Ignavibacteria bacterium]